MADEMISNLNLKNSHTIKIEAYWAELKYSEYASSRIPPSLSCKQKTQKSSIYFRISGVDIDEELLERYTHRAQPLIADHLCRRESPFKVDIYVGSIDTSNECLLNADVVIGIEIIEHLFPDTLDVLPYNIFEYIKPKIVIFTTPNAEFNVLFDMVEGAFRHEDHKFEWTRGQFEDWAINICERFTDYRVSFHGIGAGPKETEPLGCCSQMALFVRQDLFDQTVTSVDELDKLLSEFLVIESRPVDPSSQPKENSLFLNEYGEIVILQKEEPVEQIESNETDEAPEITEVETIIENCVQEELMHASGGDTNEAVNETVQDYGESQIFSKLKPINLVTNFENFQYKLIVSIDYPIYRDDRTRAERICDEAQYHLGRFCNMEEEFYNMETYLYEIPVIKVFDAIYERNLTDDINEFRKIMTDKQYKINAADNFEVDPYEDDEDDNYDDEEDQNLGNSTNPARFADITDEEEESWN